MAAVKAFADAEGLRGKCRVLKLRIRRLLREIEVSMSQGELPVAVETMGRVDSLMGECHAAQTAFEACLVDQDLLEREMDDWLDLEMAIVRTKTVVKASQPKQQSTAADIASARPADMTDQRTFAGPHLPEWELPKFSGNVLEFSSFWDQFEAGVHGRQDLSDVTKLVYLKSALTGEALDSISGFHVTNANYPAIVESLKDQFGREELVVEGHILALLQMPKARPDQNGIRDLYYGLNRHLRALAAIGKDVANGLSADDVLFTSFKQLLPGASRKRWEYRARSATNESKLNVEALLMFLREEMDIQDCTHAEVLTTKQQMDNTPPVKSRSVRRSERNISSAALHAAIDNKRNCRLCGREHGYTECPRFLHNDPKGRWNVVRKHGACYCCLKVGHIARDCTGRSKCKRIGCNGFHHELLHIPTEEPTSTSPTKPTMPANEAGDTVVQVGVSSMRAGQRIFLQTAQGRLKGANGERTTVMVLFDAGSQRSFVRKDVAESLRLDGPSERIVISTLGGKLNKAGRHKCVNFMLSAKNGGEERPVSALCIDRICSTLDGNPSMKDEWIHLKGIRTADLFPRGPAAVDVLIGADHYYDFVEPAQIRGQPGHPIAVQSTLGWIVCGRSEPTIPAREIRSLHVSVMESLDDSLRRFWEIEELGLNDEEYREGIREQADLLKGLISFDGKRYSVALPWKTAEGLLPDNYDAAFRRLKQTEARLIRNPSLSATYSMEMNKYIESGYVEKTERSGPSGKTWYLPHHMVCKEEGSTRYRIVFDASSRYQGISLNDVLNAGPPMQNDLLGIILRFRRFRIGLQADISKMFMQVCLRNEDRDASRFLWRPPGTDDPPEIFRFTRICFGLNCSPFLAMSVVKQHVQRLKPEYGTDVDEILKNMYVDDVVTSCNTIEDAQRIVKNTSRMLSSGGFRLSKWATNVQDVLNGLAETDMKCDGTDGSKVLGLTWDRHSDSFTFRAPQGMAESLPVTKRQLVSTAAKLYDPLGVLMPFTVRAKILFQRTWQSGAAWDEALPTEIAKEWLKWKSELAELPSVTLPRRLLNANNEDVIRKELHVFTDASEDAYGAAIYLKAVVRRGDASVAIVASKSKVAPLKKQSVPRLELMGALLGARLVNYVRKAMEWEIDSVHCWTDSKVVLCWIRSAARQWKPFVKHRVEKIQSLTEPGRWKHCPGRDNPADTVSRGSTLSKLVRDQRWWHGPSWLALNENVWPSQETTEPAKEDESIRKERCSDRNKARMIVALAIDGDRLDPTRFSDLEKLLRVTAYCMRFVGNCRCQNPKRMGPLDAEEMSRAEKVWIRRVQLETFEEDYEKLRKGGMVSQQSKLVMLDAFIDEGRIIRAGGRLHLSDLPVSAKHPVILPSNHWVVDLLIRKLHEKLLHAGTEQTLAATRQRFWILRGRSSVKRVLQGCVICKRQNAAPCQQKMGILPPERLCATHAFQNVGMDFAGPVYVRKDCGSTKAYILLLTCLTVRAVHLELVHDMSTNSLIQALTRFFARRGVPKVIYSDNFRTFRKVANEIGKAFTDRTQRKVHEHLTSHRVVWKFITQRAPWTGGAWERLIRSVKTALRKTLRKSLLTAEEMATVLCEVEVQINARPLTFVGEDPKDLDPLTPFHFLHGRAPEAIPTVGEDNTLNPLFGGDLRKRWQYQRNVINQLWKRWKEEYVIKLMNRPAWTRVTPQITPGAIVLISEEGTPRTKWCLGRVLETFPSKDGLTRTVKVRTAKGDLTRPVQKLHLIEAPGDL